MLTEIRDLGFSRVELSHGIHLLLVPGILRALQEGWIEISSVHNFCPLPSGVMHCAPNLFQPSARNATERTMWLRSSRRTMEFANLVGASRVVMHSGSISFMYRSPKPVLEQLKGENTLPSREKALTRLHKKGEVGITRVLTNYEKLLPDAETFQVELGIENREGILELPIDAKFSDFFEHLPDSERIGYWHDTGHAQIKDRLGLLKHRTHLENLADRLLGFHLHDVNSEGHDHQVPGTGSVDFDMIREFVRPHHTLVAELSPRLSRDEVTVSRDYLLEKLA